ncbi:MAG: acylphosphatase [Candidatus Pelagisphaera sp.]
MRLFEAIFNVSARFCRSGIQFGWIASKLIFQRFRRDGDISKRLAICDWQDSFYIQGKRLMESLETVFHLTAHFAGHVQGVGFRYSTRQVASGFEVTGYVKNLADGRVEVEMEGAEIECRRFLKEIESELDSFIRKTETREGTRERQHTGFGIY